MIRDYNNVLLPTVAVSVVKFRVLESKSRVLVKNVESSL